MSNRNLQLDNFHQTFFCRRKQKSQRQKKLSIIANGCTFLSMEHTVKKIKVITGTSDNSESQDFVRSVVKAEVIEEPKSITFAEDNAASGGDRKWTTETTAYFLQILSSNKKKLTSQLRRRELMKEAALLLNQESFNVTYEAVCRKWNNMLITYRRCRYRELKNYPVTWEHYEAVKEIASEIGLDRFKKPKHYDRYMSEYRGGRTGSYYIDGTPRRRNPDELESSSEDDLWDDQLHLSESILREGEQSYAVRDKSFKELELNIQRERNDHLKLIADNLSAIKQNQGLMINFLKDIASNVSFAAS